MLAARVQDHSRGQGMSSWGILSIVGELVRKHVCEHAKEVHVPGTHIDRLLLFYHCRCSQRVGTSGVSSGLGGGVWILFVHTLPEGVRCEPILYDLHAIRVQTLRCCGIHPTLKAFHQGLHQSMSCEYCTAVRRVILCSDMV